MSLFLKNNNIAMELKLYNPHWEKDYFYNIEFKRNYFQELVKNIDNKFIINML
jgi:hypothetical protein